MVLVVGFIGFFLLFNAAAIGGWGQAVEAALAALGVVEVDVVGDGLGEGVVVVELAEVVHFAFEDAPEGFHGGVVDAHAWARHALEHALVAEFDFEFRVGVLKTAVAVDEGVGVGVFGDGAVEGGEDEVVVVMGADGVGDDVVGFEVEDGGEVEFFAGGVLKFGDVGEPFFVGVGAGKIAGEDVGGELHRGCGVGGGLFGADDGTQAADFGEAVKAFVVVVGVVAGVVFVAEAAVAVDAAVLLVELCEAEQDGGVFAFAGRWAAVQPAVVGGAADGEGAADFADGVALLGHVGDDEVVVFMANTAQSHLLSRMWSFFRAAFSTCRRRFSASRILYSACRRSRGVMVAGSLRLPRLSMRPSRPYFLYLRTQE